MEVRGSRGNGSLLVLAVNSVLFSAHCREMGHALSEKDGWFTPIILCLNIALKTSKLHINDMKLRLLTVHVLQVHHLITKSYSPELMARRFHRSVSCQTCYHP